jgi:hypothetical protein
LPAGDDDLGDELRDRRQQIEEELIVRAEVVANATSRHRAPPARPAG